MKRFILTALLILCAPALALAQEVGFACVNLNTVQSAFTNFPDNTLESAINKAGLTPSELTRLNFTLTANPYYLRPGLIADEGGVAAEQGFIACGFWPMRMAVQIWQFSCAATGRNYDGQGTGGCQPK